MSLCIAVFACRYVIYNRPEQGSTSTHRRDFSVGLDEVSLLEMPTLSEPSDGAVPAIPSVESAGTGPGPAGESPGTPSETPGPIDAADCQECFTGDIPPLDKAPEWRCVIDGGTGMLAR